MLKDIPSKQGSLVSIMLSLAIFTYITVLSYGWHPVIDTETHNNLINSVREYKEEQYALEKRAQVFTKAQVQAEIRAVFPQSQWQNAYFIVSCESSYNQKAHGDRNLMHFNGGEWVGDSIGLFQIRTGGRDFNRARANNMTADEFRQWMFDPRENIKYAYTIWKRYGFAPWSCSNTK